MTKELKVTRAEVFENTASGGSQVKLEVLYSTELKLGDVLDAIAAWAGEQFSVPLEGDYTPADKEEKEPAKRGRRRRKDVGGRASDELDRETETEAEKEEPEPEPEPDRPRRRRRKTATAETETEKEKPRRRRRKAKESEEPEGPTKEDVAKAASLAASELGAEVAAEIILDYSTSHKIDDIPVEKRQEFIDDVNNELSDDDEE